MMKELTKAVLLAGTITVGAPLVIAGAGEAVGTPAVSTAPAQDEGVVEKVKETASNAVEQTKSLFSRVFSSDARLERAQEKIEMLENQVLSLEAKLVEKSYVSSLAYRRSTECISILDDFLKTQVRVGE